MPESYRTLHWNGDATGCLRLIDQTLLPTTFREIDCRSVADVREAIVSLRVRGAPAIGVAAAYGIVIGCQSVRDQPVSRLIACFAETKAELASSRPTAVNLFWALDRMERVLTATSVQLGMTAVAIHDHLLCEAQAIELEDQHMCAAIGRHGSGMVRDGMSILTHCNAGGLATAGDGTALSVIFAAAESGKAVHVFADETRPLLQGARLTSWELQRRGIPVTVICDNLAAQVMKEGRVQLVITGADRIATNGDAANKIGTYGVAVLARHHGIPFVVAAPSSTFDLSISDGSQIPIEQRAASEITNGFGRQTVPDGVAVYNPAFDVTPASLIHAIVTERGIIAQPTTARVQSHLA